MNALAAVIADTTDTDVEIPSLSSVGMLATLHISTWSANRKDRQASAEFANDKGIKQGSARVNKTLINSKNLDAYKRCAGEMRAEHNRMTSPWFDTGARVLNNKAYFDHTTTMGEFKEALEYHRDELLDEYEADVEQAKIDLGPVFKQDDYPTLEALKHKFGATVFYMPVPEADDWRVRAPADLVEEMIKNTSDHLAEAAAKVQQDIFLRVKEVVENMVVKLEDADYKFKNSLVGNVEDVVAILPTLNLTGDPKIHKFIQDVQLKLCFYDAETIRTDQTVRADVASKGRDILKDMSAYVGS
jgi:hypothetical protein